jgi:hypothetical protein
MKKIVPMISAMVLVGSLAGAAFGGNTPVPTSSTDEQDYCHMRFPAIRPRTLATDHPQLKRSSTGDQIDFYGPCDERPTGKDQVISQKLQEQFRFGRDYEDGD